MKKMRYNLGKGLPAELYAHTKLRSGVRATNAVERELLEDFVRKGLTKKKRGIYGGGKKYPTYEQFIALKYGK